jgi:nitric oxide reductase NorE protein
MIANLAIAPSLPRLPPHQIKHALCGDLAMWFFILAELLVFGILFISYALTRARHVELFNASQLDLDRVSGFINTLLLVTSSYFVVRGVAAVQKENGKACAKWLMAAMLCGAAFAILKMLEFASKIDADISMSTNSFYMFYLFLGFFHFMHVILGMVILGLIARKAWQGGYSSADHAGGETRAAYWHLVDLVWIVLFPLIYVLY